jgi:pimeloyl-ACP methyl ester carboxylesterase
MQTTMTACGIEYLDSKQSDKPVYLLLHGVSSGAGSWVKQFESLGERYRLIAWNAPGYARSRLLDNQNPSADDYADVLKQFCEELSLTEVTVVGHSLGALIGAAFVAKYPQLVKRFVMASVARGYGNESDDFKKELFERRQKLLVEKGFEGVYEQRSSALIMQQTEQNYRVIYEVMSRLTIKGFRQAVYLLAYDSIQKYVPFLKLTPELIFGQQDEITTSAMMSDLEKDIQFSKVSAIDDAGHLVYLDQPKAFNQAVFL